MGSSGPCCSRTAPQEAVVLARRAQAELPSGEDDLRRRLESLELTALFFGADDESACSSGCAVTAPPSSDGVGARMLASIVAWGWTLDGGSADLVAALASWAFEDGTLIAADSGLMSVVATIPLALADRDDAVTYFNAIAANASTRGSVFATTGRQLWGGYTALLRASSEAERDLRDSLETLGLWGVPGVRVRVRVRRRGAPRAGRRDERG